MSASERPARRLILTHALLSGGAGLVPLPILDDSLAAAVRRQLVRRVADARQVDLSAGAVKELVDVIKV